jgi:leader peptidase (prepilin peptidase)/N-methyltransferase
MTLIIFIYGITIGSFLNVCIYRIPREESIAFPSSHCPSCGTSLSWYDNIPLFSYLSLMGKCRYCKAKISLQYPLVEALNGLIYLILFYTYGLTLDFLFYGLISSTLIVITFIDLKDMIIPDILVVIILVLSSLHKVLNYFLFDISPELMTSILGLLVAGGLFLAIVLLSRGGIISTPFPSNDRRPLTCEFSHN